MSTTDVYGDTYDFFPDGHYIHPFRNLDYDYSHNEAKEHPRTVGFPLSGLRPRGLTGGSCGC